MLKELHAVTGKYGKVQDMTNFKTMIKINVISISKKRKRCDSIAQRAAMNHYQYETQRGGRATVRQRDCILGCTKHLFIPPNLSRESG
jgi:hypothetical protein